MILVINVCSEKLHYLEFVKPVEDILKDEGIKFFTRHYEEVGKKDVEKADKVIVCGTSLRDNEFLKNIDKFSWIKDFEKPLLGICSGMQIIGLVNGEKIKKHLEIGYFYEEFDKEFLGLKGRFEVYHLHNNYIDFSGEFEVYSKGKIPQAVKHKFKEIYGVLFHPEVRQKNMIGEFVKL